MCGFNFVKSHDEIDQITFNRTILDLKDGFGVKNIACISNEDLLSDELRSLRCFFYLRQAFLDEEKLLSSNYNRMVRNEKA